MLGEGSATTTDEMDASEALLGIGTTTSRDSSVQHDGKRKHDEDDEPYPHPPRRGEGEPQQLPLDGDQSVAVDRDSARAQFQEAMASVPDEDTAAYMEAVRRVPSLVARESNPDLYLEYDSYDPWKAALRVANYWKTRAEIFGDRAFLPLTLTGDGAMSSEDVKILRTGFFMVLPNDKQGRTVVRATSLPITPSIDDRRDRSIGTALTCSLSPVIL
jgi:hypothetical protein